MSDLKPLIVLTGPTAVGKTALSIALAKAVDGEIISADSMQVYRGMDIGSAKITKEEMCGVPHHLIDILNPEDEFNVTIFQEKCKEAIDEIISHGRIPILTGGTGFYIQAVLKDVDFTENDGDVSYRRELEKLAEAKGCDELHNMLREVDPASAEAIHKNNIKRTIRALEYFHQTGRPISAHNETEKMKTSAYNSLYFVLNDKRDRLYSNIEKRVDIMFELGLLEEVNSLKAKGYHKEMVSMQGIGYKEILMALDGEMTLEEARELIKQETRHFAKRQLTWFRREKDVIWINKDEFSYDSDRILQYMMSLIEEHDLKNIN